jgi:hypothetical protein
MGNQKHFVVNMTSYSWDNSCDDNGVYVNYYHTQDCSGNPYITSKTYNTTCSLYGGNTYRQISCRNITFIALTYNSSIPITQPNNNTNNNNNTNPLPMPSPMPSFKKSAINSNTKLHLKGFNIFILLMLILLK